MVPHCGNQQVSIIRALLFPLYMLALDLPFLAKVVD